MSGDAASVAAVSVERVRPGNEGISEPVVRLGHRTVTPNAMTMVTTTVMMKPVCRRLRARSNDLRDMRENEGLMIKDRLIGARCRAHVSSSSG